MEFTVGQQVSWSNLAWSNFRDRYGPGPFEVVRTETMPEDRCTCGNRLDDGYHENGECFYNKGGARDYKPAREAAGHSQMVFIKTTEHDEHQFSGAYFTAT